MAGTKKKIYDLTAHSSIADTDVLPISATASGNAEKSTASELKTYVKTGLTTADVTASTDKNYVTDAQATVIGNTSGVNTGDQVGDGVTITGAGTAGDPFVAVGGGGSGDVTASGTLTDNAIILGGGTKTVKTSSKTIVTTLGADNTTVPTSGAVAAAISGAGGGDVSGPASSTDSNVAMFNGTTGKLLKDSGVSLSGSNTGDEDTASIKTKLGAADTDSDGYLTSTDWNTFNGKQAALSVASGAEVDTGTDNTKMVTAKAIADSKLSYTDGAETLTNKRITKRVVTTTDDATAVIDVDTTDVYELSAIANDTEFTLTGTPTDGQMLMIRYKDAGAAKALTFTGFTALGVTIPTTTVISKRGYVGSTYNAAASQWHVIAVGVQA